MRRWILIGLATLLAYAVALIATLPADRALQWGAEQARGSGVNLAASGVSGSVWHGRAASASINGMGVGAAEWSLSPWWLAAGNLDLHWRAEPEGGWIEGDARLGGDGATVRNLEGRLPAPLLMSYFARAPAMVAVDGTVALHVEELVHRGGKVETVKATVLWTQAALTQPAAVGLGDIKAEFTPAANGAINGKLSDGGGPLGVAGTAVINPDLSYRLDVTLTPRAGADPLLANSMPLLGRPDGKGGYRVVWSGRIPR